MSEHESVAHGDEISDESDNDEPQKAIIFRKNGFKWSLTTYCFAPSRDKP